MMLKKEWLGLSLLCMAYGHIYSMEEEQQFPLSDLPQELQFEVMTHYFDSIIKDLPKNPESLPLAIKEIKTIALINTTFNKWLNDPVATLQNIHSLGLLFGVPHGQVAQALNTPEAMKRKELQDEFAKFIFTKAKAGSFDDEDILNIQSFIKQGVDLSWVYNNEATLLMIAVRYGSLIAIQKLINAGANANQIIISSNLEQNTSTLWNALSDAINTISGQEAAVSLFDGSVANVPANQMLAIIHELLNAGAEPTLVFIDIDSSNNPELIEMLQEVQNKNYTDKSSDEITQMMRNYTDNIVRISISVNQAAILIRNFLLIDSYFQKNESNIILEFITKIAKRFGQFKETVADILDTPAAQERVAYQIIFSEFLRNRNEFSLDIFKSYLQRGVDLSWTGSDGETPLITAARFNNLQAVQTLIAQGVDVNQAISRTKDGVVRTYKNALQSTIYFINLRKKGLGDFLGSLQDTYEILSVLLKAGADPNTLGDITQLTDDPEIIDMIHRASHADSEQASKRVKR